MLEGNYNNSVQEPKHIEDRTFAIIYLFKIIKEKKSNTKYVHVKSLYKGDRATLLSLWIRLLVLICDSSQFVTTRMTFQISKA